MINLYDMEADIRWFEKHQYDDDEQSIIPSMLEDMRFMLDELKQLREGIVRPDGWPVRYHQ